jgi:hypothetical protein
MSNRKISLDEDTNHPLPLQIPERRRTVSLGGLRHFYESIGGGNVNTNGTNQYPAFGMLRDMSGSSPLAPYSVSNSMPNQPTSYLSGHSPVSDTLPSPTGVGLSGLLRRASWIEGTGSNTTDASSIASLPYGTHGRNDNNHGVLGGNGNHHTGGQHLFNSLPNRMRRPGVLRQDSDMPATRASIHPDNTTTAIAPNNKVESMAGLPDTVAGGHPFVKARSESALKSISDNGSTPALAGGSGQQAHPRVSALAAPTAYKSATGTGASSGPERPATPMSNMILSGQMLD